MLPPKFQRFCAGSLSTATVTATGFCVKSNVLSAPFQVPLTSEGAIGVPPNCQSPEVAVESAVVSVMKRAGYSGREQASGTPEQLFTSTPAWLPVIAVA